MTSQRFSSAWLMLLSWLMAAPQGLPADRGTGVTLVSAARIWDGAPHCAFTDLTHFRGRWICVFREGTGHVSPDGAVRVIASRDGERWESVARLSSERGDLRDPKIVHAPGHRLMLTAAVAHGPGAAVTHRTLAWFSDDGERWSTPVEIGEPNLWLWRVTWSPDWKAGYGIGYSTTTERLTRLYRTTDGCDFEALVPRLFDEGYPNESSIVFMPGHHPDAICLLRRDGDAGTGKLGIARFPYTAWEWKDLGVKIGGPHLLRLPGGRLIAGVRLYDQRVRTSLAWIDPASGHLAEAVALPSGGDTSYPGMVWRKGQLWVSYYSSHEGRTAIYLARVSISRQARRAWD